MSTNGEILASYLFTMMISCLIQLMNISLNRVNIDDATQNPNL